MKGKITAISDGLIEDNSSQKKNQLFPKLRKGAFLFHHHLYLKKPILQESFYYSIYTRKKDLCNNLC